MHHLLQMDIPGICLPLPWSMLLWPGLLDLMMIICLLKSGSMIVTWFGVGPMTLLYQACQKHVFLALSNLYCLVWVCPHLRLVQGPWWESLCGRFRCLACISLWRSRIEYGVAKFTRWSLLTGRQLTNAGGLGSLVFFSPVVQWSFLLDAGGGTEFAAGALH